MHDVRVWVSEICTVLSYIHLQMYACICNNNKNKSKRQQQELYKQTELWLYMYLCMCTCMYVHICILSKYGNCHCKIVKFERHRNDVSNCKCSSMICTCMYACTCICIRYCVLCNTYIHMYNKFDWVYLNKDLLNNFETFFLYYLYTKT